MGIIASNAYLASTFSTGALVGATATYLFLRFRSLVPSTPIEERFKFADPRDEYRLVMAIRNDLKMQKGKVAAQCGHAAVAAYAKALKQQPELLEHWMRYGGTKITVRLDSEGEMLKINDQAKKMGVLSSIIRDAGQTQVVPGSRTVIAIGPAPKSVLDQITGHLKLY